MATAGGVDVDNVVSTEFIRPAIRLYVNVSVCMHVLLLIVVVLVCIDV